MILVVAFAVYFIANWDTSRRDSPDSGPHTEIGPANDANAKLDGQRYAIVAKHLADSHLSSPDSRESHPNLASVIATCRAAVCDLKSQHPVDTDLRDLCDDGAASIEQLLSCIQSILELPRPPGDFEQFLAGFVFGFTGQFSAFAEYDREIRKQNTAMQVAIRRYIVAASRVRAATLLLPRIAKKLSGPATLSSPLEVDIDEAVVSGPDLITLRNQSGRTLHNCTVVVALQGTREDTANIHFVDKWASGDKICARYDIGTTVLDQVVGRTTVSGIQNAMVSLYCDELSDKERPYQYVGAEKDKDVQRHLDSVTMFAHCRMFSRGLISTDPPAVVLCYSGRPILPKCKIAVECFDGSFPPFDSWHKPIDAPRSNKFFNSVDMSNWREGETKVVEFPGFQRDPRGFNILLEVPGTRASRKWEGQRGSHEAPFWIECQRTLGDRKGHGAGSLLPRPNPNDVLGTNK
jgi:hypothetical protein